MERRTNHFDKLRMTKKEVKHELLLCFLEQARQVVRQAHHDKRRKPWYKWLLKIKS